jgi:hypothetical protein
MFSGTRRITGRAAKTKGMLGFSGLLLAGVKGGELLSGVAVGKRYFGRLESVEEGDSGRETSTTPTQASTD